MKSLVFPLVGPGPRPRTLSSLLLLTLAGLLLPVAARAQTASLSFSDAITTLGFDFNAPNGVAVDGSGNVYVADWDNNAVKEMPAGCASSSCVTALGGGFSLPLGVAVDGSGNVYVADQGNNAVKEMPAGCTSSSCVTTLGGGFDYPYGVAVDGNGNVYVADHFGRAVKEMPAGCASSSCVSTLGGGFQYPQGVAVDGSGNVYVADYNGAGVKEMPAGCASSSCVTALGGGFGDPNGVAVDAAGNIYVADYGDSEVKEMPAGCASSSCVTTLVGNFDRPGGVAVDGSGNVYVADIGYDLVFEIMTRGVNFLTVPVEAASAALTLTFTFDGAGSLSGTTPYQVLTEGAKNLDFTATSIQESNVCNGATPYTAGETCTVNVTFKPAKAGQRNGAVELLNAAGTTIATAYVYGTGQGPQVVFSPSTQSTLGGGFNEPYGVAVDGSGNIYVADYPNNAVREMPAGCASSSCVTTLGGGFSFPAGVAVDGSGNVYVADAYNDAVKQMPAGCASSSCVTTLGGGFSYPEGVAVDGSGNVYVADSFNSAVKQMPAGCASSSCVTTLGGGFSGPTGVAVDGSGNVYVGDYGNQAVKQMPAGCASPSCVTMLGAGFIWPYGVAVDASGNVYVGDNSYPAVYEMPAGCASSSCVTTLSGSNSSIYGVALDGSGNVYVAAALNSAVMELNRATPPALSFAATMVGSTSTDSPQTMQVANIGNAALNFTGLTYPADFLYAGGDPRGCTNSTSLNAGQECDLPIEFTPQQIGFLNEDVVLTDNALNVSGAQQSIPLSGTGAPDYAVLTAPTSGTTLCGSTSFSWTAGTGPTAYWLYLGTTGVGSSNLYSSASTKALTETVNIPCAGATVYAKLGSLINGAWHYYYCTFVEAAPAVLTSPTPGSTLTSASATFKWTAGTAVTEYDLYLGTTGVGSNNLFQSGHVTATSAAVTTLPENGATIYARLLSLINGAWQSHDYTFTEASPAKLTSPTAGSVLAASNVIFNWTTAPLATDYDLYVGSTGVGSNNLYQSGHIAAPTTTATVPTLPTNSATVYVRLLSLINGTWQSIDYTFKESPPAGSPAQMMTPTQGSVLGTSNIQFTWTAGTNVTSYDLYLGTAVGTNNLYQSGHIAAPTTTVTVPKLPATGATVYARLLSLINGAWQHTDYTYTEQ